MSQSAFSKIRCENLWKIFGPDPERIISDWALFKEMDKVKLLDETGCVVGTRNATFSVGLGEIYCIMGLSGSGKSTVLRCLNRLHEPTHGKVFIDDLEVTKLSQKDLRDLRRRKTSMVFQHFGLLPHRRIAKNVSLGLELQGIDKAERERKAHEALELVGLKGWEQSYPYELSGGMQQRVGLARALATDPEILLMDEAFSALDPLIRRQMQDEFIKLIKKVKKTIVFVTHDLNEALRISTKIAVMKEGAIVQQGTPADIVLHPKAEYVAEFVRDLPKIKFITAKDILEDPEKWLIKEGQSISEILKKMDRERIRFGFIVGEDQRVKCALDYFQLTDKNRSESFDNSLQDKNVLKEFSTATPDTFLEDLLKLGAENRIPIVVKDHEERLLGIIPRETLLIALTKT